MSDVDVKTEAGEPTDPASKPLPEDTVPAATVTAPTGATAEEEAAPVTRGAAAAAAATADEASSDTITAAEAAAAPIPTEAPQTEVGPPTEAEETKDETNADEEPEPVLPRRSRRAAFDVATQQETEQARAAEEDGTPDEEMGEEQYENGEADAGDEGVTRCVCGSTDENVGLMIQCEECKAWQHCICMGMEYEEECPDVYFCEQCKPELHIPLLKSLGVLKENGAFGNYKGNGSTGKKGIIMGPNGKPSKNPARDQARELREAKEAVARLAQENAQRHREAAAAAEQEAAAAAHANGSKDRKGTYDRSRKRSESRDVDSGAGASSASSAAALAGLKSPKRRNTMNSRDSAYGWETIPPGLLNEDEVWEDGPSERGSRKRQRSIKEEGEEDGSDDELQPPEQIKRRRLSSSKPVEEPEPAALPRSHKKKSKSKGKMPDDPNAPPKPKHPNQYTYRPKVKPAEGTAPSRQDSRSDDIARGGTPALGRAVSPTPSPSKIRDRRSANNNSRTGTPTPNTPGSAWILPDHLHNLVHYLPTPAPTPLMIHVPSTKGISRTAVAAERERLLASKSGSSNDVLHDRATPQPYNVIELTEQPTRVKFPGKRMTMGEMRKRVRMISEYVTRMQLEAVERGRRTSALGIKVGGGLAYDPTKMGLGSSSAVAASDSAAPANGESSSETSMDVDSQEETQTRLSTTEGKQSMDIPTADTATSTEAPSSEASKKALSSTQNAAYSGPRAISADAVQSQMPQSMMLLEALTAELVAFQRKFGVSGQGVPPTLASSLSVAAAIATTGAASAASSTTPATTSSSTSNVASGLGLDLGTINNTAMADA